MFVLPFLKNPAYFNKTHDAKIWEIRLYEIQYNLFSILNMHKNHDKLVSYILVDFI